MLLLVIHHPVMRPSRDIYGWMVSDDTITLCVCCCGGREVTVLLVLERVELYVMCTAIHNSLLVYGECTR